MLTKIFEEQVRKTPNNIAVKTGTRSLTYEQLNRYANRISHFILAKWPGNKKNQAGKNVGLLLDHGIDMIAAILGTLKAGKIYVPISIDYPEKRISYMLSNSESSLILTSSKHEEKASKPALENNIDCLDIDIIDETIPDRSLQTETGADEIAYIMYTSGSTGNPKGVVQTHGNVLYYINNWTRVFSIAADDKMTLFSSFCHDGSVQDMFAALFNGATLLPYDMRNRENSIELSKFLVEEEVTIWHSVPSLFSFFCSTLNGRIEFEDIRFVLLGGEEVREHEVDLFKNYFPGSTLANVYGQTESSVNSIRLIGSSDSFNKSKIGVPLDETEIFVVDKEGDEVDSLQVGEILVAGPYISPGYWKNEEASQKAFVEDDEYGRLYWTGDQGRLLLDGSIEFFGREDNQVKIRGFRVELGEIESQLLKHDKIKEAVVLLRGQKSSSGSSTEYDPGDKFLCAYFTIIDKDGPGAGELREFLSQGLPDYMVPAHFIELEHMPLTQSGKIDRRSLPEPEMKGVENYEAPADDIEERLLNIWSEVLGVSKEKIGAAGNFFEFGGHSLRAVTLISKAHQEFDVKIPLVGVFKTPTVRGLAGYIRSAVKETFNPINTVEKKAEYVLSFNQKRLWFIDQMEPGNVTFNINQRIVLEHDVSISALKESLGCLMTIHESLRTGFMNSEGKPCQFVIEQKDMPFDYIDISSLQNEKKERKRRHIYDKECRTPFDLFHPPLFRALLVKVNDRLYDLIFNIHHIVSDGWSMEILKRDFIDFYESFRNDRSVNAAKPNLQYKDFAEWQDKELNNDTLKESAQRYWKEKISEGFPVLRLPFDFTDHKDGGGAGLSIMLEKDIQHRLKQFAADNQTTLFIVMYSAYTVILSLLSGQKKIVSNIISAGRDHISMQDIVGYFVNSLIVRNDVDPKENFNDFMQRVNGNILEAFQHQAYPLELVLDELKMAYPRVSTAFNMFNIPQEDESGIKKEYPEPIHIEDVSNVKFDLIMFVKEYGNGIELLLHYKKSLFKPKTIEMFTQGYRRLLTDIVPD